MPFLYRLLLRLYPLMFRQRYAAEMLQAFLDRRAAAGRAGKLPLLVFHVSAIGDLLVNATGERAGRPGPGLERQLVRASRARTSSVVHDARFALRMLWKRPAVSVFSAATLALGIGAITAVASLVEAVLVAPLPFPRPAEIMAVRGAVAGRSAGLSYENLRDLDNQATTIATLSPFFAQSVNLTGVAEPDRLRGGFVASAFFEVLGVPAAIGAPFDRRSDIPGSERLAVLTDATWNSRFGARRDIIGQRLQLNNATFTVVGVMPASFRFPVDDVEVFLPFWTTTAGTDRGNHNYMAIARLAPEATVGQATSEVAAIASSLERSYPEVNGGRSALVQPLKDALVEDTTYPLQLLAVMVTIMLLAACANVAGLQLSATAARRSEICMRAALGAGRIRIARQLLIESLARAVAGAILGVAAGRVAITFLVANAPPGIYGLENARLSPTVVLIAVLGALIAGVAAGLAPALVWSRGGVLNFTGPGNRTAGDAGTSRLRGTLVICQVALAVILLVAAGLTTRSFTRLTSVDVGFDTSRLLTLEYRLPKNKYPSSGSQSTFHRQVLEKVRAIPGVVAAASVRALPFSGNGSTSSYRLVKRGEQRQASFNAVSDRYFETMRIPLVAGRLFPSTERGDPSVIVSQAFADRTWPAERALGRHMYFDDVGITASVIGVVGDVRHRDLADGDDGTIYTSQDQNPSVFNTLTVRTTGPPMVLADAVRRAVWAVDPDQPVWKIRTVETLIDQSIATRRFLLQLVLFFGTSSALLAVLGLYGVVASAVASRTREIGVRVALGATRGGVLSLVLWTGLRLGVWGVLIGLAGAVATANLLRSFLYGISTHDPLTFAGAAAVLLAAALCASGVPAVRALRVDPVVALRRE